MAGDDALAATAMILGADFEVESHLWCMPDTAAARLRLAGGDTTNVVFVDLTPSLEIEAIALRRTTHVPDAGPIGTPEQAAILDAIKVRIQTEYVLPEVGEQMAVRLTELQSNGRYDQIVEPAAFALRVTEDLHHVYLDQHMRIREPKAYADRYELFFGPDDSDDHGGQDEDPVATQSEIRIRTVNAGDQSLGYIGFDRIMLEGPYATDRLRTAVETFADADGLIVDLRGTRGGDGHVTAILSNQLFAERRQLLGGVFIDTEASMWIDEPSYADPDSTLPLIAAPMTVLINEGTGSAAEAFAFAMQVSGRATIVGAQSAGAGHRVTLVQLADGFGMDLPIGRSFDPATGEGWEGVGVTPDIAVSSDLALPAAISAMTGMELAEAPHQH